jgi:hypothetical protein
MKKGMLIYKIRGPVYAHFALIMLAFYLIFRELKSELFFLLSGMILIIIGEAIRLWAASYIGTCGRKFNLDVADLSISGPYSYVRNPIYLGNFIWAFGFVVLTKLWFLLPYFFGWLIVLYIFIIPDEEKYLLAKFGKKYSEYTKRVNRLFPKFSAVTKEKACYDLKKGLINEMHVLIFHIITISVFFILSYLRGGLVWM